MRGVTDGATVSLVAAQWLGTRIPYKKLLFTSHDGLTTYDFSTDSAAYGDRILGIDHREECSETENHTGGWAVITLNNPANDIPDLKGYWVEIGHGHNTGTVAIPVYEYCSYPRQWVKKQTYIRYRGQYIVILELEDFWARMGEIPIHQDTWFAPDYYNHFINQTVMDLLRTFITLETSHDLTSVHYNAYVTLEESDGIIDVFCPKFFVNEQEGEYETLLQVVTRLIEKTACYIVLRPTNKILVVYPGSSTTPDITYYRDTSPQYTGFIERTELVRPNRIRVFGKAIETYEYTDDWGNDHYSYEYDKNTFITGTYDNTTETDRYEDVFEFIQEPSVPTQVIADQLAEVRGSHRQPTDVAGRVTVRHDCRVELYDRIAVVTNA